MVKKKEITTQHIAGPCNEINKNQRCLKCFKIIQVTSNGKSKFKEGSIIFEVRDTSSNKIKYKNKLSSDFDDDPIPCWKYDQN